MKVCLICVEIFASLRRQGFEKDPGTIDCELVKHVLEVFPEIPRGTEQKKVE